MFGRKGLMVLIPLVALWLSTSACSCATVAERLSGFSPRRTLQPQAPPTATARATEPADDASSSAQRSTPAPGTERRPEPSAGAGASSASSELLTVPAEANKPFILQLTEEQINRELAGRVEQQQGVTLSEAHVAIMADEVALSLQVTHRELGLSTGVTAYGVPNVVDGAAFVRITRVDLDNSLAGLARAIAQKAIDQAIQQYSTPQGIPIPAESVRIEAISLSPGTIVIAGRTR